MSLETTNLISIAHITVPANDLVRTDIEKILRNKLRDKFEGSCNKEGFVKKINQIKHIGNGTIVAGAETCPVTFPVAYLSNIINIKKRDLIFGARIKMIEEFGIVCTKEGIVDIVIKSTDLPENYQSIFKINDYINVRSQIDGEFTIKGNKIYTIGTLHYYTITNSLDKMCKFLTKKSGFTESFLGKKIKILAGRPATKLIKLGLDKEFEDYKNKIGANKSGKNYRVYRDILNPYELLCPTEYYRKLSGKGTVPKLRVVSRAYFKMWEILKTFSKLVNINDPRFVCANLAEGPGGFIQAVIDYREKYSKNHAADKFYGITLPSKNNEVVPKFNHDFIQKYKKKLNIEYGDLTNPTDTKKYIAKFNGSKAELVTGDAGFQFDIAGRQFQEQVTQQIIFSQLLIALSVQKKEGSFVCKMFDAYTLPTIFIMQLVRKYYSSFVIFKPETSRPANSERYFIAYKFKGINATELKHLHELHAEWHKLDPSGGLNPTKYITDIINHTVSPEFMSEFKVYNQKLSSFQKEKFREIDAAMSMKLDDPVYFEKQEKIAIEWCKKMDIPT